MESFTVTDEIFARLASDAKDACSTDKMPFEIETLTKIRHSLIKKANYELQDKLGKILEAAELV